MKVHSHSLCYRSVRDFVWLDSDIHHFIEIVFVSLVTGRGLVVTHRRESACLVTVVLGALCCYNL